MTRTPSLSEVEEYLAPYEIYFSRSEAYKLAAQYVLGLLLKGDRKSVEPMANRLGVSKRSLQRLLAQAKWDHAGVLNAYRKRMIERYSSSQGILVIGQTAFPKRGSHSVCVARQYIDEIDRMLSSQTTTDSIYVNPDKAFPWAMDLYVPKFWGRPVGSEYRARRQKTGMPVQSRHHERWKLGIRQAEVAADMRLGLYAVTAGSVLGKVASFRDALDGRCRRYVVEVPPEIEVFTEKPVLRQDKRKRGRGRPRKRHRLMDADIPPIFASSAAVRSENPDNDIRLEGAHESSGESFLALPERVWPAEGYREGNRHEPVWLARACTELSGVGTGCRYYLGNLPSGITKRDIEQIGKAGMQASVCKATLINDLGLLHHEGRSWTGWHRHVLLVFLAFEFLAEHRVGIQSLA